MSGCPCRHQGRPDLPCRQALVRIADYFGSWRSYRDHLQDAGTFKPANDAGVCEGHTQETLRGYGQIYRSDKRPQTRIITPHR